jgi:sec-independent protein translocase protein TatC
MFKKKRKEEKPKKPSNELSFLEHLEALRWHIVRALAAIMVIAITTYAFESWVFENIVFAPKRGDFITYRFFCSLGENMCFQPPDFDLITKELGEQFFTSLKVSFWLGLIASFPYVFYEVWKFIKPGLYKKEQKAARGLVAVCSFLFLTGIAFGYYLISPFAIKFLAGYSVGETAITAPTLASYVNYMTMFTLPTGIAFELPIIVYFLSTIGMLKPSFMRKYRKHAFVIILLLAAIITPPDVITQILIGIPIFILYEISIIISSRVAKKLEAEANE